MIVVLEDGSTHLISNQQEQLLIHIINIFSSRFEKRTFKRVDNENQTKGILAISFM